MMGTNSIGNLHYNGLTVGHKQHGTPGFLPTGRNNGETINMVIPTTSSLCVLLV